MLNIGVGMLRVHSACCVRVLRVACLLCCVYVCVKLGSKICEEVKLLCMSVCIR